MAPYCIFFHAIEALVGKRQQQQLACRGLVDAARAQIKQSVLLNLTNGRTMRTLHVVGINFQLRLGVDLRIVGEQQITICLLGISLLRVLVDNDAPVKNAVRMTVEDAAIKLPALAVRLSV